MIKKILLVITIFIFGQHLPLASAESNQDQNLLTKELLNFVVASNGLNYRQDWLNKIQTAGQSVDTILVFMNGERQVGWKAKAHHLNHECYWPHADLKERGISALFKIEHRLDRKIVITTEVKTTDVETMQNKSNKIERQAFKLQAQQLAHDLLNEGKDTYTKCQYRNVIHFNKEYGRLQKTTIGNCRIEIPSITDFNKMVLDARESNN